MHVKKLLVMLVVAFAVTSVSVTRTQEPAIALGDLPLLFVDDSGIAKRESVVRTIHAAKTHQAPVIQADRKWEGDRVYIYGAVQRDEKSGELRMWYNTAPVREGGPERSGKVPGLRRNGADLVLLATSSDGLKWTKPSLGRYAYDGDKDNNIVFDVHSPSVIVDARESDPAKRYKMLGAEKPGNYVAAYSADGLTWTNYPKNPVLQYSDTITFTQHPLTGAYMAYHKRPATVRGFPRRVVWLSTSTDMQAWSEPELVFGADEVDDQWVTNQVERTEVYNMSVFPHASGFLGLPTIFRVIRQLERSQVAPGQSPLDGPIDVELATSIDGRTWERTSRRTIVIPRGAPGTFDGGAILGVASNPVHTKDETWVYYTALTTGHGAPIGPKKISIGRADWRRNGFASLDAGPDGGRVETRPLRFASPTLTVNADASRGRVRVALLEADGSAIAGYTFDDSAALTQDATRWTATWRGAAASTPAASKGVPTDRPVRVAIEMTSARLFSLETSRAQASK
jgi:hypothetical protein